MKTKLYYFVGTLFLLYFLSYFGLFVFSPDVVNDLTFEDHLYENTQAIGNLIACILFFVLFFRDKSGNDFGKLKSRKNVFFLLLAVFFFFGFGEEISWGQRIFNWQTPAALNRINVQQETNIHNIEIFNYVDLQGNRKSFLGAFLDFNRIFSIFWLVFCVLVPILDKSISRFSGWMRRLNFPMVPIWIGVLFPLNYLTYKIIEKYFTNSLWNSQSEVKETVFAILFAAVSIWFVTEINKAVEPPKA